MGQLDADPVGAEPVHQIGKRRRRPLRAARRQALGAHGLCGSRSGCASARLRPRSARHSRSAACPSHRRPDAQSPAVATVVGNPPARGPAPAGAVPADRDPRCGRHRRATTRRRTPSASPVPWRPRRTAPPRRARRGRSARWPADRAGRPPRRAPPACWHRRGSCTPNARATRRTGRWRPRPLHIQRLDSSPRLRDQAGLSPPSPAGLNGHPGTARLAVEHPLHLAPARRPGEPAHPYSLSNICSSSVRTDDMPRSISGTPAWRSCNPPIAHAEVSSIRTWRTAASHASGREVAR